MKSVRKWGSEYFLALVNISRDDIDDELVNSLLSSERGKSRRNPCSIINNANFRINARDYVHKSSFKRGAPNMTLQEFQHWVQSTYDRNICVETARAWLLDLGFSRKNHHKSVYFDGHEREDVVECRAEYVKKLSEVDKQCRYNGHTPQLQPGEKELIQVFHDESTFYSNADQACYWDDGSLSVLKQKSLGQSIMVSDFIEEASCDYLKHNNTEARLLLETQTDRYFDSKMLLIQVDKAIDIFEAKYPEAQGLFIFDNAPSHKNIPTTHLTLIR